MGRLIPAPKIQTNVNSGDDNVNSLFRKQEDLRQVHFIIEMAQIIMD